VTATGIGGIVILGIAASILLRKPAAA